MNKIKALCFGLAMSLTVSQTAQAAVLIAPFGSTNTAGSSQTTTNQTGAGQGTLQSGQLSSMNGAAGGAYDQGLESVIQAGQTSGPQAVQEAPGGQNTQGNQPVQNALPGQNGQANQGLQVGQNALPGQTNQNGQNGQTTNQGAVAVTTPGTSLATETLYSANISQPKVNSEAAIVYDVTHGRILMEKQADKRLYPASITKLLTALVVLEHAKLDETVTFSKKAVTNLESGAVTLQVKEGDKISVKDCLYGLLVRSANEVANGLAEHVGGSVEGFAKMMNDKAKALGCTDSNFVNPNGLNNSNHYTSARDMAKIAAAAFKNETLTKIASTTKYTFPETKAAKARTITMGHKMLHTTDSRYYEGIVGGKTGYTSLAGNTLVTCAERNGVRLVAVVLKAPSASHYADTKAMLDYGFALNNAGLVTTAANSGTDIAGAGLNQWTYDGKNWYYERANGTKVADTVALIDGETYAFRADGTMVTGWYAKGDNWHYFGADGAMEKQKWAQDANLWFYLDSNGVMARNTWIDNQYYVGSDGAWVQ